MSIRTIQSPGVQIFEKDASLRPNPVVGTSILIPGFAPQGPTEDVIEVTSLSEFETIYGKPTNAAERYFYHSVKAAFQSNATILTTRLPYGSGGGDTVGSDYSALVYPVVPVAYTYTQQATAGATVNTLSGGMLTTAAEGSLSALSANGNYVILKPTLVSLTETDYNTIKQGNFNWSDSVSLSGATLINPTSTAAMLSAIGKNGIIVLNDARSITNDRYEGYYLGLTDTINLNPATNFDSIINAYTVNANSANLSLELPVGRRNFILSAASPNGIAGSVSEALENIPSFNIANATFKDSLVMGLFKIRQSIYAADTIKLDYVLSEGYVGSLDSNRTIQRETGGSPQTFFLGRVEDSSPNISVLVNPNISTKTGSWLDINGTPTKGVRLFTHRLLTDTANTSVSADIGMHVTVLNTLNHIVSSQVTNYSPYADCLVPLGYYQNVNTNTKYVGSIPDKLNRIFQRIDNIELVNIDISVDAGLSNIYAVSKNTPALTAVGNLYTFDDTYTVDIGSSIANTGFYQLREGLTGTQYTNILADYLAVLNEFRTFAEFTRKDHIFISDPLRNIFVQGDNYRVLDDKTKTFTQHVYWPLRHLYGSISSSYMATYANYGRVYDGNSDRQFWCPMSGFIAATMANNDEQYAPWYAPAGFERGRFSGVNGLAIEPSQKSRDQLYKINVNPITRFPNDGIVIFGQKTMYKTPSSFDRINVRRLFLWAEKSTYFTLKYFLFAPNTVLTRTRVINNLTPILELAKNNEGIYGYNIVCDTRNNTPDVIDANELKVDVYISAVRAAEFILATFTSTRTGVNFEELVR